MNIHNKKAVELLIDGNVTEAVQFLKTLTIDEVFGCLYYLEDVKIQLLAALLTALIVKDFAHDPEWINVAFTTSEMLINYYPGSYEMAAHYARLYAMQEKSDEGCLVCLLSLTYCPDGTLDPCEAVDLAHQELKLNQESRLATGTIERFTKDGVICEHVCMLKEQSDKALAFEWLIYQGKFPEAELMLPVLGEKGWRAQLLFFGAEQRNLGAYAFVLYLINKTERADLHYLAYRMMTLGYPRGMFGSNIVGYYHITKALELEPGSITYMEQLFLFYLESDDAKKLVGKERVTAIAQKLSSTFGSLIANNLIIKDEATGTVSW